jgi:hypothetical protein
LFSAIFPDSWSFLCCFSSSSISFFNIVSYYFFIEIWSLVRLAT